MKFFNSFFFFGVLLFSCTSLAQDVNPLTDAIRYRDFKDNNKDGSAAWILNGYYGFANETVGRITVFDSNKINEAEKGQEAVNHFLAYEFAQIPDSIKDTSLSLEDKVQTGKSSGGAENSNVGSLVANALATVVVNQFKQELSIAFIDGLRQKLEDEKELQEIFPKTFVVLHSQDVFNTNLWLTTLRESFNQDLQALPMHLPALVNAISQKTGTDLTKKKEFKLISTLYPNVYGIVSNPDDSYNQVKGLIDTLEDDTTLITGTNTKAIFKFFGQLLPELANDAKTGWADKLKLEKLASNTEITKAFVGFVLQAKKEELKKIQVRTGASTSNLYDFINGFSSSQDDLLVGYVREITSNITSVLDELNALKQVKDEKKDAFSILDYQSIVQSFIGLGNSLLNNNITDVLPINNVAEKWKVIFNTVNQFATFSFDLGKLIEDKNYAGAFIALFELLPKLFSQEIIDKSTFFTQFVKYSDFAINMVSAKTAEELANAINAAALPVQSYRLKRKSPFSITLNAYAGGFYGFENLNNDAVDNSTSDLLAFAAPIGVGFNWALGSGDETIGRPEYTRSRKGKKGKKKEVPRYLGKHSLSLFLSVIDVGALAVYRLSDDQAPAVDLEFQNILAPGAQIIFGWGKTPLSIGAGIQYGPELRDIRQEENGLETNLQSRGWRYGLSVLVDIPLFQIHKKTFKNKSSN